MVTTLTGSSTRAKVDERLAYYLGSWRRSPFDPNIMPQSLNVDEKLGVVRLGNFDAEFNNLFRFHFGGDSRFILELMNPSPSLSAKHAGSSSLFLTSALTVRPEKSKAALWELSAHAPFRNGPLDVSLQVRLAETGAVLCSSDATGKVSLIDESQADRIRDKEGNHAVNIAWEATPDCDEAVPGGEALIPDWLQEMMLA